MKKLWPFRLFCFHNWSNWKHFGVRENGVPVQERSCSKCGKQVMRTVYP